MAKAKSKVQGKNFTAVVEGNELVIRVNLMKDLGMSKSGRTTLIATSSGGAPPSGPAASVPQ